MGQPETRPELPSAPDAGEHGKLGPHLGRDLPPAHSRSFDPFTPDIVAPVERRVHRLGCHADQQLLERIDRPLDRDHDAALVLAHIDARALAMPSRCASSFGNRTPRLFPQRDTWTCMTESFAKPVDGILGISCVPSMVGQR